MSFSDLTTDPPEGFQITQSGDGYPAITYRYWWSVIVFTFRPDRLVVERRSFFGFFGYDRSEFPKQGIRVVRQVPTWEYDPTWELVIEGGEGQSSGKLLSRQLLDKSDWLGPLVALWAGVAFDQWNSSK